MNVHSVVFLNYQIQLNLGPGHTKTATTDPGHTQSATTPCKDHARWYDIPIE